jgi:hypothetical protein
LSEQRRFESSVALSEPAPVRESTLVTLGAVGAIVALSFVVGVISSLYATELVDLGPVHVSVGAVIAGVFDLVGGLLAGWLLTSRDAVLLPGLGWFLGLAVLVFVPASGGDVLVPGSGDDVYAFLAAGVGGTVLAGLIGFRDALRVGRRATPGA